MSGPGVESLIGNISPTRVAKIVMDSMMATPESSRRGSHVALLLLLPPPQPTRFR
jgi:hypothetical protein